MLPFGFIKILFGKIFWNKVVKKRRKKRSYWRASRCNPLKDKDVVFQNSGYPPCRRLRRIMPPTIEPTPRYPPCRRLRRNGSISVSLICSYPPCRRLRRQAECRPASAARYPPCRRLRSWGARVMAHPKSYPPCRRLRSPPAVPPCAGVALSAV